MSHARNPQRRYMHGETAYLMDYLQAAYPGRPWMTNVRVGPLDPHIPREGLDDSQRKLMGAWRRFVDAIVVEERELVIIETKIVQRAEGAGSLLVYLELVPETPDLSAYMPRAIRAELVCPIPDRVLEAMLAKLDIRYVYFPWERLDEYMLAKQRKFLRSPEAEVKQTF